MSLTLTAPTPTIAPIAPAEPLTDVQQDSLLLLSASTEKIQKVKRSSPRALRGESRAWAANGNVD